MSDLRIALRGAPHFGHLGGSENEQYEKISGALSAPRASKVRLKIPPGAEHLTDQTRHALLPPEYIPNNANGSRRMRLVSPLALKGKRC